MLMQVAPGYTRSRNPENPIENKAMVPRASTAPATTFDHEWLKTVPFLVAHQTPDHGSLPKSHLDDVDAPAPTVSRYAADRHPKQEEERLP